MKNLADVRFVEFSVTRQISFHQVLNEVRGRWLIDALRSAVAVVDPNEMKNQLVDLVPKDVQRILASSGIRDEEVFPAPAVLLVQPTLVGYYRLLLGVSQKIFYRGGTGMGPMKSMETKGTINKRQRVLLPEFCTAMSRSLVNLVRGVSPSITSRDVQELPLLMLGGQLQGAHNVSIGNQATFDVFQAIGSVVDRYVIERSDRQLTVRNSAGRRVEIQLSADPDVSIREEFDGALRNKVAIEIKGGTDLSNVHNRAGEAEKSHLKAKGQDFRDFWTIIPTQGGDIRRLQAESPTTTSWFDARDVLRQQGTGWDEFQSRIAEATGIPLA